MEVDSTEEEEAKGQGGPAQGQVSKSNHTGASFNTLSSLSSLRPGNAHALKCLLNDSTISTGEIGETLI